MTGDRPCGEFWESCGVWTRGVWCPRYRCVACGRRVEGGPGFVAALARLRAERCPSPWYTDGPARLLIDLALALDQRALPLALVVAHGIAGPLDAAVRAAWAACDSGYAMGLMVRVLDGLATGVSTRRGEGVDDVAVVGARTGRVRGTDAATADALRAVVPPDEIAAWYARVLAARAAS